MTNRVSNEQSIILFKKQFKLLFHFILFRQRPEKDMQTKRDKLADFLKQQN